MTARSRRLDSYIGLVVILLLAVSLLVAALRAQVAEEEDRPAHAVGPAPHEPPPNLAPLELSPHEADAHRDDAH